MLIQDPTAANRPKKRVAKEDDVQVSTLASESSLSTDRSEHRQIDVEQAAPANQARHPSTLLSLALWVAAIVLGTTPWLFEGYTWCAWLGLASAMQLAIGGGVASRFWSTWLWSNCLLGAAFHWSPAAMQYTLSSSFLLGFVVALPLIIWDGLRMALGFWIAARLTRDVRYYWFAAACCSIALEYLMPGVFPWKIGLTQLSYPWLIQGIDLFGPSFSTLVAFAVAGVIHILATTLFTNGFKLQSFSRVVYSPAFIALTCICLYNAFAWYSWSQIIDASPQVKIGLIQVDPSYVESSDNLRKHTASVAGQVDLICWPESSAGNYDMRLTNLANDEQTS